MVENITSAIQESFSNFIGSLYPELSSHLSFVFLLVKIILALFILYILILILIKLFKIKKELVLPSIDNNLQILNKNIESLNNSLSNLNTKEKKITKNKSKK